MINLQAGYPLTWGNLYVRGSSAEDANMHDASPEFLLTGELARRLRVCDRTLELLRKRNQGPPFIRLSRKRVIYPRAAVEEWLATRQVPQPIT
jgi:hypothetical protein